MLFKAVYHQDLPGGDCSPSSQRRSSSSGQHCEPAGQRKLRMLEEEFFCDEYEELPGTEVATLLAVGWRSERMTLGASSL